MKRKKKDQRSFPITASVFSERLRSGNKTKRAKKRVCVSRKLCQCLKKWRQKKNCWTRGRESKVSQEEDGVLMNDYIQVKEWWGIIVYATGRPIGGLTAHGQYAVVEGLKDRCNKGKRCQAGLQGRSAKVRKKEKKGDRTQ